MEYSVLRNVLPLSDEVTREEKENERSKGCRRGGILFLLQIPENFFSIIDGSQNSNTEEITTCML